MRVMHQISNKRKEQEDGTEYKKTELSIGHLLIPMIFRYSVQTIKHYRQDHIGIFFY